MTDVLLYDRPTDGVALLTLNRPARRNALSIELLAALTAAFGELAADAAVRAVVLTGAPPVFCAGFDLTEMSNPALLRDVRDASSAYHRAVYTFGKPLVCAINGPARAGGFDLTLLADLRLAADTASFAHPEIHFGAAPLFTPLRWIVGDGRARDLCLTGREIDAHESERIGLVSRVLPVEDLLEQALNVARDLAALPGPVAQLTKEYMAAAGGRDFEASFVAEHDDAFDRTLAGLAPGEDHERVAGRVAERLADVQEGR